MSPDISYRGRARRLPVANQLPYPIPPWHNDTGEHRYDVAFPVVSTLTSYHARRVSLAKPHLPRQMSNSFNSIVVHGLVKDNSGADAPFVIERGFLCAPLNSYTKHNKFFPTYKQRASEVRPDLSLSPSIANLDLHLVLDEQFPYNKYDPGRAVYRVSVDDPRSSPESEVVLPRRMVIKVAGQTSGRDIAQEAIMYNHLLRLQGVVIPRCYGYFRQTINLQEYVVTPWNPDTKFPRTHNDLDVFDMPNTCANLNVLLLGYVGEQIPQGFTAAKDRYKELRQVYLASCALMHW